MSDDELDAFIRAAARVLGLAIDPAWQAEVRANLRVLFAHAEAVEAFGISDEAEPAPVFRA